MIFLNRLLCFIFNHDLYIFQEFKGTSACRVKCYRCDIDLAVNRELQLVVPWGKDFEELYKSHGHYILK